MHSNNPQRVPQVVPQKVVQGYERHLLILDTLLGAGIIAGGELASPDRGNMTVLCEYEPGNKPFYVLTLLQSPGPLKASDLTDLSKPKPSYWSELRLSEQAEILESTCRVHAYDSNWTRPQELIDILLNPSFKKFSLKQTDLLLQALQQHQLSILDLALSTLPSADFANSALQVPVFNRQPALPVQIQAISELLSGLIFNQDVMDYIFANQGIYLSGAELDICVAPDAFKPNTFHFSIFDTNNNLLTFEGKYLFAIRVQLEVSKDRIQANYQNGCFTITFPQEGHYLLALV